ncbi:hypothetical protein [Bradyrhizobium cenepequi]
MHLSPEEQQNLTITYAMLLGGEIVKESHNTWWCSGWVGESQYIAAVRFLERERGYYLHSNGTLMRCRILKP